MFPVKQPANQAAIRLGFTPRLRQMYVGCQWNPKRAPVHRKIFVQIASANFIWQKHKGRRTKDMKSNRFTPACSANRQRISANGNKRPRQSTGLLDAGQLSSWAAAGTFMAYQPDRPVESGVIASLNGAIGKAKWARSSTRQWQRPQSGQRPWCELSCSRAISRSRPNQLEMFCGLVPDKETWDVGHGTWAAANWSNNILLSFVARRDKWLAAGTFKERLAPEAKILQSFECGYLPTLHLHSDSSCLATCVWLW